MRGAGLRLSIAGLLALAPVAARGQESRPEPTQEAQPEPARPSPQLEGKQLAQPEAAPEGRSAIPHIDLDGLFTYGLGNGSALGGQLHVDAAWNAWRTRRALGTLELGLRLGYFNEPMALQPWTAGSSNSGTTHRIPFAVTVGHGFRWGRADRFSFGLHVYAGGVRWISHYYVRYPSRGIEGPGELERTVADLGAFLRFTYRPHRVVGLAAQLGGPFYGIGPETVVGLFTVGIGLTVRLR